MLGLENEDVIGMFKHQSGVGGVALTHLLKHKAKLKYFLWARFCTYAYSYGIDTMNI